MHVTETSPQFLSLVFGGLGHLKTKRMANRAEIWEKKIFLVQETARCLTGSPTRSLGFGACVSPRSATLKSLPQAAGFMQETGWPEKSSWWGSSVNLQSCVGKGKTSPTFRDAKESQTTKTLKKLETGDFGHLSTFQLSSLCNHVFQMPTGQSDSCDSSLLRSFWVVSLQTALQSHEYREPNTEGTKWPVIFAVMAV